MNNNSFCCVLINTDALIYLKELWLLVFKEEICERSVINYGKAASPRRKRLATQISRLPEASTGRLWQRLTATWTLTQCSAVPYSLGSAIILSIRLRSSGRGSRSTWRTNIQSTDISSCGCKVLTTKKNSTS